MALRCQPTAIQGQCTGIRFQTTAIQGRCTGIRSGPTGKEVIEAPVLLDDNDEVLYVRAQRTLGDRGVEHARRERQRVRRRRRCVVIATR